MAAGVYILQFFYTIAKKYIQPDLFLIMHTLLHAMRSNRGNKGLKELKIMWISLLSALMLDSDNTIFIAKKLLSISPEYNDPIFFRCNYHWQAEILVLLTQLLYLGPVRLWNSEPDVVSITYPTISKNLVWLHLEIWCQKRNHHQAFENINIGFKICTLSQVMDYFLCFSWPSCEMCIQSDLSYSGRIYPNTLTKYLLFQMSKKVFKDKFLERKNQAQDEANSTIGTVMVHKPKAQKPISPSGFKQSCYSAFKRKWCTKFFNLNTYQISEIPLWRRLRNYRELLSPF